jgi:hypothetical protein
LVLWISPNIMVKFESISNGSNRKLQTEFFITIRCKVLPLNSATFSEVENEQTTNIHSKLCVALKLQIHYVDNFSANERSPFQMAAICLYMFLWRKQSNLYELTQIYYLPPDTLANFSCAIFISVCFVPLQATNLVLVLTFWTASPTNRKIRFSQIDIFWWLSFCAINGKGLVMRWCNAIFCLSFSMSKCPWTNHPV